MSTNNHIDLIEFPAKSPEELQATTKFFADVFGWKYQEYGEEYSDTQDSGVGSGINATGSGQSRAPLTVIYVEDLDAAKDKIVKAGGKILVDTYSFPGGRRFHFADPAGHELAIWSE